MFPLVRILFVAPLNGYFEEAGISGHFTNHSLRATVATRMFDAGIDKQLIMHRTGHSSAVGVRNYKRVKGEDL